MSIRLAINGFGRIGRLVYRAILESKRNDVEVVCVNDLGPATTNAHLLKYDSVHGILPADVTAKDSTIDAGRGPVRVTAERDPSKLPWKEMGVDIALECTGLFTSKDKAKAHLDAGARRVLISAPADGVDFTVVYGINNDQLSDKHIVVSNGSCTTNCIVPVAYVLHNAVGIQRGFMTTVHSYTGDQVPLDTLHKDLRRARAAGMSMIPTSTGAARAVSLVLPELKGKIDGTAIRVPTPNVSLIDFTFVPKRKTSKDEVNDAVRKAAGSGPLKGVLGFSDAPLVSHDYNHDPRSSILDSLETQVIEGEFVRVLAWYDNEWGFSNRMVDTSVAMGKTL